MAKGAEGPADIVIIDLEDAVAEAEKPKAREMVAAFLAAHPEDRALVLSRNSPFRHADSFVYDHAMEAGRRTASAVTFAFVQALMALKR